MIGNQINIFNFEMTEHPSIDLVEKIGLNNPRNKRGIVLECFSGIEQELRLGTDDNSRAILVSRLELFLNYCNRFYARQFSTRFYVSGDIPFLPTSRVISRSYSMAVCSTSSSCPVGRRSPLVSGSPSQLPDSACAAFCRIAVCSSSSSLL
jgi:hypothetical protein